VLNGLSFKIRPSEKIGIVGRTGAGKSSLLTALLSLAPLESGKIEIDGVDINEIGVDDLRSKLSIIPQDPCIFDGNVRHNIDPFGKYSDSEIWETLRRVHLADAIDAMPNKLDSELADEGANFSLGQRQLLCVGRAILRRSKILLLDEASSSIDLETDYLLQRTLRTEFADCTTITIAHRLATIMDSDRVMVLEAGMLKEFDSPVNLLSNPNSLFSSLHQQAQSSASH
jgi:ABC-type multidrug transport system fused ATPase/permease subunit